MKTAAQFALVLVTVPHVRVARQLARAALAQRLVACANIVPGVESHYTWKGKVETGKELLVLFKATRRTLPALEQLLLKLHPYDTPEIIVVPVHSGTVRYLKWWTASVK